MSDVFFFCIGILIGMAVNSLVEWVERKLK